MLKRIPMLVASNPDKIFIMAGTNDLIDLNLDEYGKLYSNLIQEIKNSLPNSKIYIQSVLPSNHEFKKNYASNKKIQKANLMAKELASKYDCQYIKLYYLYVNDQNELIKELTTDGVHLFPDSYMRWSEAIRQYVNE